MRRLRRGSGRRARRCVLSRRVIWVLLKRLCATPVRLRREREHLPVLTCVLPCCMAAMWVGRCVVIVLTGLVYGLLEWQILSPDPLGDKPQASKWRHLEVFEMRRLGNNSSIVLHIVLPFLYNDTYRCAPLCCDAMACGWIGAGTHHPTNRGGASEGHRYLKGTKNCLKRID